MTSGDWTGRSVFVTGATGLLGSWLTGALVERAGQVTCLVRARSPESRLFSEGIIDRVRVVWGGVDDPGSLARALEDHQVDTVFHLAAQAVVGTATRTVLSTFETNIQGTWHLLEACRARGDQIRRIVVASSDKAYGDHPTLPYSEQTPLHGRYPYDASKACADVLAHCYAATFDLPIAITRCGNLYGGGDLNFSRIVPGTIRSALRGDAPVIRSNGRFVRDYFYVEDAVEAYLLLADRLHEPGVKGRAFNFAPTRPLTVLELVERILRAVQREDLEPRVLDEARHEIKDQYLDCSLARRTLGWRPLFTLEEGLDRTVAWYRRYLRRTS